MKDPFIQEGFHIGQPVFIRIFKQERVLEIWLNQGKKAKVTMPYLKLTLFAPYLAPLALNRKQEIIRLLKDFMRLQKSNSTSNYHRAFNLGYPNVYDVQNKRTGSALMVHGACASVGCYAMTDEKIVAAALNSGQSSISVHIFPFHFSQNALDN